MEPRGEGYFGLIRQGRSLDPPGTKRVQRRPKDTKFSEKVTSKLPQIHEKNIKQCETKKHFIFYFEKKKKKRTHQTNQTHQTKQDTRPTKPTKQGQAECAKRLNPSPPLAGSEGVMQITVVRFVKLFLTLSSLQQPPPIRRPDPDPTP